jgi:nitrite reductase/ring-hydroxylating ferredoxin subunit
VVCPLHAWKVCLESGAVRKPQSEACLMTFPVETVDGVVCIDVPPAVRAA